MSLFRRVKALFSRAALSRDIDDELASHIEMRTADNIAAGMPSASAKRDATLRLGNATVMRERVVAVDAALGLDSIWSDLRLAARRLWKSPGFTTVAILTLGLGIGVNSALFSVVQVVLLRPLPYKNPSRLVVIWQADAAHRGTGGWFNAYREYEVWKQQNHSFERMAPLTWATEGSTVLWKNGPVDILPIPTGADFFSVLGAAASKGRTFLPSDLSNDCTLVLSNHFWQLKLGAPADIVRQTLTMGGKACQVIGVMPSTFSFYPLQTDAWTLITPSSDFVTKPWTSMTGVFGLLKPGVTRAAAEAELTTLQSHVAAEAPPGMSMLRTMTPDVLDLQSNFTWLAGRNLRTALWVLMGAVLVILLMACINIATLLLGRASERSREMAVRTALGSSRARLFSQLFAEISLLAVAGTVVGVGLSVILLSWFRSANPIELPPGNTVALDWRVFLFSSLLGLVSALLSGLLPALQGSQVSLSSVIKSGERGLGQSSSMRRASQWFITFQVALSLMLLTGAGLLGESLLKMSSISLGYRTEHLLTAHVDLPKARYTSDADRSRLVGSLSDNLRASGIPAIALASDVTPKGASILAIEGLPSSDRTADTVSNQDVSSNFFSLMHIPILLGRAFDTRDHAEGQKTAIINEALARKYFKGIDPLGKTLKLSRAEDQSEPWLSIVGVSADVKTDTVFQEMGYVEQPAVYRPVSQHSPSSVMVIVPTERDAAELLRTIQGQLGTLDKDLLLKGIETVEHKQALFLAQPRFRAALFGCFAALALLLAVVGLYGVLLQSVLQRTREIGLRMACGANRSQILRSILGRALTMICSGLLLGALGSLVCSSFVKSLLYGVTPHNPLLLGAAASAMLIIGVVAAFQPALRASSIDPVIALRSE